MSPEKELWRTIRLHCPTLSKTMPFEVSEEQRLDLGSISRAFGLEPSSVRLNGHFISRGIDLISNSVTWRSMLRFFSSKGLSTGADGGAPLIVEGKLLKVGSKRKLGDLRAGPKDPEGTSANGNGIDYLEEDDSTKPRLCKKLNCQAESKSGSSQRFDRKHILEEVNLILSKRLKINGSTSDSEQDTKHNVSKTPAGSVSCRYMTGSTKRCREDDAIVAAPFKRVR